MQYWLRRFWIANRVDLIDPAVLRRFDYA